MDQQPDRFDPGEFARMTQAAAQRTAQQMRDSLKALGIGRAIRSAAHFTLVEVLPAMAKLAAMMEDFRQQVFPPNWAPLPPMDVWHVMLLMRDDGLSLAWTPPTEILRELLAARTLGERLTILVRHEAIILDELEALLGRIDEPDLAELSANARESLEAYRSGYHRGSQALTAATLTTAIHRHFAHRRLKKARAALAAMEPNEAGVRQLRLSAVMSAVAASLSEADPLSKAPRARFNRHASLHTAVYPQYTAANSLNALMLLISFLIEIDNLLGLVPDHDNS
jgi:hypothetical protein